MINGNEGKKCDMEGVGEFRYNERVIKLRQALFWDTDPQKIDPRKNAQYVIERIADLGNDREARWVLDFYDRNLLREVISKSRCLRPRTKALWTLLLKA